MAEPKSTKKVVDSSYMKYAGMATQLLILLLLAAKAGTWLDARMENEKPLITALLLVVSLLAFLFKINHDLSKH